MSKDGGAKSPKACGGVWFGFDLATEKEVVVDVVAVCGEPHFLLVGFGVAGVEEGLLYPENDVCALG